MRSRPEAFRRTAFIARISCLILAGCTTIAAHSPSVTASGQRQLYLAEQLLIRKCMNHAGFSYWASSKAPQAAILIYPFGLTSRTWAEKYGFGDIVSPATNRNAEYMARLSPARFDKYVVAFNGPGPNGPSVTYSLPDGLVEGHSLLGCEATAEGYLYHGFARWDKTKTSIDDLTDIQITKIVSTHEFQQADSRWSLCMLQRGYSYSSPMSAMERMSADQRPLLASQHASNRSEIDIAVATVGCMKSSQLSRVASALSLSVKRAIDSKYDNLIGSFNQIASSAIGRARRVIDADMA